MKAGWGWSGNEMEPWEEESERPITDWCMERREQGEAEVLRGCGVAVTETRTGALLPSGRVGKSAARIVPQREGGRLRI